MRPTILAGVPRVRTERLALRRLRSGDRESFAALHEASREHFRPWVPETPEWADADQLFDRELLRSRRVWHRRSGLRLCAFLPGGTLVGFFNLSEIVRGAFHSAYASWGVHAHMVGRGYGTEGVVGLLDLAFAPEPEGLGLHRVQANVIPGNLASIRVAEKAGFRREGLALRYLKIAGRWQDHIMFAKTAEEHLPTDLDSGRGKASPGQRGSGHPH